jgi:hypothetical protein
VCEPQPCRAAEIIEILSRKQWGKNMDLSVPADRIDNFIKKEEFFID